MRVLIGTICIVVTIALASGETQGPIRVEVKSSADPTKLYPSSKLYVASLVNEGSANVILESIQMPGGYAGSGIFFPCSVQKWQPKSNSWVTIHRVQSSQFINPNITRLEIKPKDERATCRSLLPKDGAREGECVRFRLSSSFGKGGQLFISKPFAAGREVGNNACRTEP